MALSAFCWVDICLPEQAVLGFPLGLGLVVEDGPTELSHTYIHNKNCVINVLLNWEYTLFLPFIVCKAYYC